MTLTQEQLGIELKDRITNEMREKANRLSGLDIGPYKKVELALMLSDIAKATELQLFDYNDDVSTVAKVLDDCGFVYEVVAADSELQTRYKHTIYVARDAETLQIFRDLDPAADHEAYGRMMGYPETAIAAFGNPDALIQDSGESVSPILPFAHSREGLTEEQTFTDACEQYVKSVMPDVYTELLGDDMFN